MLRDHSPALNISEITEEPRDCCLEMLFTFTQQALEGTISNSNSCFFRFYSLHSIYIYIYSKERRDRDFFEVNINTDLNLCLCDLNKEQEGQKVRSMKRRGECFVEDTSSRVKLFENIFSFSQMDIVLGAKEISHPQM